MHRAKRICTWAGCNKLVSSGSRCELHPYESMRKQLDAKKTPEAKRFYSSRKWTQTSKDYRKLNPLCERCRAEDRIVQATLVHHDPEREELIAQGLDPFDFQYLGALCLSCHQKELRAKRG